MKKFFKKPLNLVSFVLMLVGVVAIVTLLIIPHGQTYTYTHTDDNGKKSVATVTLEGDKMKTKLEYDGNELSSPVDATYKVEKGKLYTVATAFGSEVKTPVGEINAFKYTPTGSDEAFTCKLNVTIMVVACAMAVVGLAGTIYGSLTLKKKKK